MNLYLVRHGEAMGSELFPTRPLSQKGKADVFKIGKFLKEAGIKIDILWQSKKTRAVQTAQILAEIIKIDKQNIMERDDLFPNDPVNNLLKEIIKKEADHLMIVGHLPFLQKLSSLLLVNSEYKRLIDFSSGGVVCLRREGEEWHLVWEVIPELIFG
ncbi:phosphohistidine phosphatase SixA [bacterium]|nr:phosphohistidine phosphatase SixA [bacterium]